MHIYLEMAYYTLRVMEEDGIVNRTKTLVSTLCGHTIENLSGLHHNHYNVEAILTSFYIVGTFSFITMVHILKHSNL